MTTIKNYYWQAHLSEATYAQNLLKGMFGENDRAYMSALQAEGNGMSFEQAKEFANRYKVIDQYTDPESGFSGTVFEDVFGKTFIAIRGTEGLKDLGDWSTNIGDIGADGIAIDQAIAMYNWYLRLTTEVGQDVVQYKYIKETTVTNTEGGYEIETPARLETLNELSTGNGGLVGVYDVAVTGHSLGGHLAMIMSRIAPTITTSTLTYNSPRFDLNLSPVALTSEGFFDLLRAEEGKIGTVL